MKASKAPGLTKIKPDVTGLKPLDILDGAILARYGQVTWQRDWDRDTVKIVAPGYQTLTVTGELFYRAIRAGDLSMLPDLKDDGEYDEWDGFSPPRTRDDWQQGVFAALHNIAGPSFEAAALVLNPVTVDRMLSCHGALYNVRWMADGRQARSARIDTNAAVPLTKAYLTCGEGDTENSIEIPLPEYPQ